MPTMTTMPPSNPLPAVPFDLKDASSGKVIVLTEELLTMRQAAAARRLDILCYVTCGYVALFGCVDSHSCLFWHL